MNNKQGYKYAKKVSKNSDFYKCHTGCIAVYAGHVIAEGYNGSKSHSLQVKYNKYRDFDEFKYKGSIHAEMMVVQKIKDLDIEFSQVKIYIYRGKEFPRLSKPCMACEKALRDLGIRKIFYTGDNSYIYEKYE